MSEAGTARRRPALGMAGALGVGALLLAACGGRSPGSARSITLYSGQHVQTTQLLIAGFERKTGITVNARYADEDVLADQIVTEGSHSPADVFFSENSPPLEYLASQGLLARVDPSTLTRTPARFDPPGGKWVGISARVSVMVYNTLLLKPAQLPRSVMDLVRPQWNGKVAIAGTETDFQPIVMSVLRAHGTAAALRWLGALRSNAGNHDYPNSETVADQVNRGQVAVGLVDQYYWYRERAQSGRSQMHSAIAYFAPRDVGYVLDVSGVGILRSSTRQADAQRFVAFVNSAQGQQIIAHSDSFEYPVASGVTTAQPETPLAELRPNAITISELGTGAAAIKLLQEAQLL
ncbi:MAG TPA: extracellular solute-binding protein [Acidimicrobiales bacterium]|nr:extracellular solute-binding protein [Acidimicrobiales bacterium]